MQDLRMFGLMELGVMFWAGHDPASTLAPYSRMGIRCGQLGIPWNLDLDRALAWKKALEEADFTVYTVFAAFEGESYTDIPAVRRTVGFVPPATRAEREKRMCDVSDLALELGVPNVATHIGCLPEDRNDPDYIAVQDLVRRVCEHTGDFYGDRYQTFALETGQESAESLVAFIRAVNRPNLAVNFDPANMILYGTGDPIEALGKVGEWVVSVHLKDGDYPDPDQPGSLGQERLLGRGKVGMSRLVNELYRVGYKGPLAIEREMDDQDQRLRDIEAGIDLMRRVFKGAGS